MAWTPPKTWAVGEVLTSANLNGQLRDNLSALRDGQRLVIRNNSLPLPYAGAGAWLLAQLNNTLRADWAASGVAHRITLVDGGVFTCDAKITASGQSGAGSNGVRIARRNSAGVVQEYFGAGWCPAPNTLYGGSGIVVASAGDYLEVEVLQNMSGSAGSYDIVFSVAQTRRD